MVFHPSSRGCLRLILVTTALLGLIGCHAGSSPAPKALDSGGIKLRDVAAEAGLNFAWPTPTRTPLDIAETIGAGCAFLDFNRDGWLDVLLVGDPGSALFLNDGKGRFRDATREVGLDQIRGPWHGVAVGDYDGDGWPDLLITGYHRSVLLKNVAGRKLRDVSREAGFQDTGWASSAGWADLDGDGDLDLVVGHYVKFGPGIKRLCLLGRGIESGCPPAEYQAEFPRLFRNDAGHLVDITRAAGIGSTQGKTLALGFCDYDNDGDLDFYLANDGTPGDLFTNLGKMKFRNDNFLNGTAMGSDQVSFMAGMGVDWGDFDNDGDFDLVVTNFANFDFSLFRNDPPTFAQASGPLGIAEVTRRPLGFGDKFVDLDNDGFLDLVFANGHVYDNIHTIDPTQEYRQPLIVMHNEAGKHFADISKRVGADVLKPLVGRGLAVGDFDNDGRPDLLVVDIGGVPLLLHNETAPSGHWLGVEAREPGRGRNGLGARVTVEGPGLHLVRDVTTASSYLSSSDPRVLFGLGANQQIDRITVRWSGGSETVVNHPELGRYVSVTSSGARAAAPALAP